MTMTETITLTIEQLEAEFRAIAAHLPTYDGYQESLGLLPALDEVVDASGPPSAVELRKINKMTPKGADELRAEDVTVMSILAVDNLINSYFFRFDAAALGQMLPYAMGGLFTINHDWGETDVAMGRIIDGSLVSLPSSSVPGTMLNRMGNKKFNRKIVQSEGYWAMMLRAYVLN